MENLRVLAEKYLLEFIDEANIEGVSREGIKGLSAEEFRIDGVRGIRTLHTDGLEHIFYVRLSLCGELNSIRVFEETKTYHRKVCPNCRRLFYPSHPNQGYCRNIAPNSNRTCMETGYNTKVGRNTVLYEWRKRYKTLHAKLQRGVITRERLNNWRFLAKSIKDSAVETKESLESVIVKFDTLECEIFELEEGHGNHISKN